MQKLTVFAAIVSMGATFSSHAESGDTDGMPKREIEEVVVTAERRESSLQETPVTISAFSEEFLSSSNIESVSDLGSYAPGLNYTQVSNFAQLNMRGIGLEQINLGGEPGVAFHQDGVYIARPFVNDAVFTDLARVEILRGPQGTLYGRNATGGSINLISNAPTDQFEGRVSVTTGDFSRLRVSGLLSGALSQQGGVRGRLSVVSDRHDGFLHDRVSGQDVEDKKTLSARGRVDVDLSETMTLILSADYMREDDTGPVFRTGDIPGTAVDLGGRIDDDPWSIYLDGPNHHTVRSKGLSARLDWHGDSISAMSLTAYRNHNFGLLSDLDGTDFFLVHEDLYEGAKQLSQEFQFASANDSDLQWLLGAYYFREDGDLDYRFTIPLFATVISFDAEQETRAYALFGQVSYAISDRLKMTLGLRHSDEQKRGSTIQTFFVTGDVAVDQGWTALTPRFVADYKLNDDIFLYASIAKGFKTGGLNTGSLQTAAYDPEHIWNYEVGSKTSLLDNRIRANVALFYYKYDDLQVTQFDVGQTFIENAASAKGRGFEAEITALLSEGLIVSASLAFLDTEFTRYDTLDTFRPALGVLNLAGNDLPRAPRLSQSLVGRYEFPISTGAFIALQAEYLHQDDMYFTPFNTDYAEGGDYDLVNAKVSYFSPNEQWEVSAFVRNATDDEYLLTTTVSGINAGTLVLFGPPRTIGVEARYTF